MDFAISEDATKLRLGDIGERFTSLDCHGRGTRLGALAKSRLKEDQSQTKQHGFTQARTHNTTPTYARYIYAIPDGESVANHRLVPPHKMSRLTQIKAVQSNGTDVLENKSRFESPANERVH